MSVAAQKDALRLIQGAYDLHFHPWPSHFERSVDDFSALNEADALGMAGILLKNHYEPTGARASIANKYAKTKCKALGGLVLNWPVGGLNPYAVESAIRLGAKIVWMPTRDAEQSLQFGDMSGDFFVRKGIKILEQDGNLVTEVLQILQITKKYDVSVATGHISLEESAKLCKVGCEMGVRMILTHPDWERTLISLEEQVRIARYGTLIEKVWMNVIDGHVSLEDFINSIRTIGTDRVFLVSDRGQAGATHPAKSILECIHTLIEHDFTEEDIRMMTQMVPLMIIGQA
jgi:hypothetical protein